MSLFNYECDEVKRIIDEVSPNYPQLTTYEKEWLYFYKFGYLPGIPVELEYQEVIVNPSGSVQNAIPHSYKRAILKGNTGYRDIDTGDILDTFDETKNLELVSVNMPVLTTAGKNLFDKTKIKEHHGFDLDSIVDKYNWFVSDYIPIQPNKDYKIIKTSRIHIFDENKTLIDYPKPTDGIFTSPTNASFLRINGKLEELDMWQVEEGSITTEYEPYKSNILTVNEPIELRGIGNIKDELNLLTGELTERIGEMVLDGSENWSINETKALTQVFEMKTSKYRDNTPQINSLGLPNGTNGKDIEALILGNNGSLYLAFLKTKASTVEELKIYLSSNPITVQCQLKTESIKTVDLTSLTKPYEGTNHYHITANIPCEAILEIPVVSTGAQTLQEIND